MTSTSTAQNRAATVIVLSGAIDLDLAGEIETCLFDTMRQHTDVVVELTDAELIDCACLGVLARANRRATALGVRLSLAAPRPLVRRTISAVGLDGELRIFDDVAAAARTSPADQMIVLTERTAGFSRAPVPQ